MYVVESREALDPAASTVGSHCHHLDKRVAASFRMTGDLGFSGCRFSGAQPDSYVRIEPKRLGNHGLEQKKLPPPSLSLRISMHIYIIVTIIIIIIVYV